MLIMSNGQGFNASDSFYHTSTLEAITRWGRYVSSNRWHVFFRCWLFCYRSFLEQSERICLCAHDTGHAREHVVRLSALAPPIVAAPANSGTLPVCPPGVAQSTLKQCLPHPLYARASRASCLSFALHAPVSSRSSAECSLESFPGCCLHGL